MYLLAVFSGIKYSQELEMPVASLWNAQAWAFKMLFKYYMHKEKWEILILTDFCFSSNLQVYL